MKTRISILAVAIAAISFNGVSAQRGRFASPMASSGGRTPAAETRLVSPSVTSSAYRPDRTEVAASEVSSNTTIINEIKNRYSQSYNSAMNFCTRLPAQVNGAKIAAGVSLGTSIAGTLAAGTALGVGIAKAGKDTEIGKLSDAMDERKDMPMFSVPDGIDKVAAFKAAEAFIKMSPTQRDTLEGEGLLTVAYGMKIMYERDIAKMEELSKKSAALGTVRTVGNFIAGGTSAASAVSAFVGAAQFDNLIKDMNACDSHVRDIKDQRSELAAIAPNDTIIRQMDEIVDACSGLNSKNIADVKNKLTATGVISSVGAATGIAGGITSAVAGAKENHGALGAKDTKGLNIASNVLAGVTAGTSLTSTIISGVMLSDLMKNGDIADMCAAAFE